MAQSKLSYDEEADKSLECSICFSDFDQPKLLPCLHTFCLKCLRKYCETKKVGDLKPCPLCRREFSIPRGGVDKVLDNHFMMRMMLMRISDEENKKPSMCDPCSEIVENVEAQAFCKERKQCLCLRCKKLHSVTASSKLHSVVGIEETPSKESLLKLKSNYCSVHNDQQLELYCCDCKLVLCYKCQFQNHGRHKCSLLHEAVKQKKEVFVKVENKVKKCVSEGSDRLKQIQQVKAKAILEATEAVQSIEGVCSNVIKLINSHKGKLITCAETMKANRLKEIDSLEDLEQLHSAVLNSFLTYIRMVMERGTDCEIIRVADELHKRAEELIKSHDECDKQQLPDCCIKFLAAPVPTEEDVERLIGNVLNTGKTKGFPKSNVPRLNSIHVEGTIRGITVLNNEIFVITSNNTSSILVYDAYSGTAKPCINLPNVNEPGCITSCSHHKALYIGDSNLGRIHRVNIRDRTVKLWKLKESYSPWGLALTLEHNILITTRISGDVNDSRVVEYTTVGVMIREIGLHRSIDLVWQTVQLPGNQFITCQGYAYASAFQRLCVVNSKGEIIKSYGCFHGRGEGQLSSPCSVTIDHNRSHVFVADSGNDRVLMFSTDLVLLGQVKTGYDLKSPWDVYVDSNSGRLFIGDDNSRISIIYPPYL